MANDEHVKRLKQGGAAWNAWREEKRLSEDEVTYGSVDLSDAKLSGAELSGAHLMGAHLSGANLSGADLTHANLFGANLLGAQLSGAVLLYVNLTSATFDGVDLTEAFLGETIFCDVDLTGVIGLGTCYYVGPSSVDHRTLQKSGRLPLSFLRGVGVPDKLIDYLPSLFDQATRYYSCFISYSAKDVDFARRIETDLQTEGVRCWFAPRDLPIGDKILDGLDTAIRIREKVLLILSEHSINSDWVEIEVTTAFEEERKRGQIVLFPIRLDDVVMTTKEAWAAPLRARHIGDFRRWKEHDGCTRSFQRVLRDLTCPAENAAAPKP